ncbi:MAG: hypothetical protein CR982_03725 [Candidatus Cloacimonadota bacterium]|nr:MAG: hypothetical protein CR982_03725 [Candidatus Cloacimonadota bacterium]PIE79361.1 MAG: hypothetical protein CSA15_03375 [Candidatus Delongbacteria bacterium]
MKFYLILICFSSLICGTFEEIESENIKNGLNSLFSEEFNKSIEIFTDIKNRYKDHPIGYFGLGSVYSSMGDHYENEVLRDSAKIFYNKVIEISETMIDKGSKDPWIYFYLGSSLSNEGFFNGKTGNYFSAMSSIISGISYLEDLLEIDNSFLPAKFIIGGYRYYKSGLTSWIYDNREEHIELIKETAYNENPSRYFAVSALMWVYIDYENFNEAVKVSEIGLKAFPNSRYFLWGKGCAFFKDENYLESNKIYIKILDMIEKDIYRSNYNYFMCYYRLCKGFYEVGDLDKSRFYMNKCFSLDFSDSDLEKIGDRFDTVYEIRDLLE